MTQSGYSFTPGKYDTTKQIDVVPEQEKSNARILASEEKFLQEMNARDDALVNKTRSDFESLANLSSSFAGWLEKKAEKDKKERLQAGAALALKIPASEEDIQALVAQEDGLKDAHLKINEIANRIEEETGSFELAEQFRNLSGWEQYAYVKASLKRAAGNYTDFKNERRETIFLVDEETKNKIFYSNADESQRRGLDAKIRHEFSEQFIGVNEKLLSATVAPEILKVDENEITEARKERDARDKKFKKETQLNRIKDGLTGVDANEAVKYANFWVSSNSHLYGNGRKGVSGARLSFRDQVQTLVLQGKLPLYVAQNLNDGTFYHKGDKKNVKLSKFKEFEGFEDDLIEANTNYLSRKKDDDKYVIESNAAALREELDKTNTLLTKEQKQEYLKNRKEKYPDQPLNADELSFLYGYRDDDAMRQELLIKYDSLNGITEEDLKHASPALRIEMKNAGYLVAKDGQQIYNLNQLPKDRFKRVDDLISESAKSTGTLEAKNQQYYSLYDATSAAYLQSYNSAMKAGVPPADAHAQAFDVVKKLHDSTLSNGTSWVDANSVYVSPNSTKEYEQKLISAQRNLDPENAGYATRLLEAPREQKEELQTWAANGGKGPVPYYYRMIVKGRNILPRELAWKQAAILNYEGQWDEDAEIKKFNIPKSMITFFINNNPTKNGKKRFGIEVETYDKDFIEEVHPYEENEDFD